VHALFSFLLHGHVMCWPPVASTCAYYHPSIFVLSIHSPDSLTHQDRLPDVEIVTQLLCEVLSHDCMSAASQSRCMNSMHNLFKMLRQVEIKPHSDHNLVLLLFTHFE